MTREEAIEYDNALKHELEKAALQYDMAETAGDYLVDNFITVVPEDARKALIAGLEYVASVNQPESIFNYIQMTIVSVLFVIKSVKQEIGKLEAQVIYFLHERCAYEVGIEEEEFICAMQKWYQQREGGALERKDVQKIIHFLQEIKVIVFDDGKIFLAEKVYGKLV